MTALATKADCYFLTHVSCFHRFEWGLFCGETRLALFFRPLFPGHKQSFEYPRSTWLNRNRHWQTGGSGLRLKPPVFETIAPTEPPPFKGSPRIDRVHYRRG